MNSVKNGSFTKETKAMLKKARQACRLNDDFTRLCLEVMATAQLPLLDHCMKNELRQSREKTKA